MKANRSQSSSPELPSSASPVFAQLQENGKKRAHLLELRTETGPIYVCPSAWQRVRLQRAFRHFRVLAPQLLSRSDQRLITKLLQTAVVTPPLPVASGMVFGVVEKVHSKPSKSTTQLAIVSPQPAMNKSRALPLPVAQHEAQLAIRPAPLPVSELGLRPWIVSGATAAACIPLIMASVYGISLFSSTREVKDAPVIAAPIQSVDFHVSASGPAKVDLPKAPTPRRRVTAASLIASRPEPGAAQVVAADGPGRPFVSELPPGHFAHPVVGRRNLVGEVRLRALIGADGSVNKVTVLSGNPRLAQAAMRAVMRWHYSPYEVMGDPVAVETEIRMSFFGPDAVSIASVAGEPSS